MTRKDAGGRVLLRVVCARCGHAYGEVMATSEGRVLRLRLAATVLPLAGPGGRRIDPALLLDRTHSGRRATRLVATHFYLDKPATWAASGAPGQGVGVRGEGGASEAQLACRCGASHLLQLVDVRASLDARSRRLPVGDIHPPRDPGTGLEVIRVSEHVAIVWPPTVVVPDGAGGTKLIDSTTAAAVLLHGESATP